MRFLSFDIGTKRTGVAYYDDAMAIVLPLETIEHAENTELAKKILTLVRNRSVQRIILGLPLLLSGAEGKQAAIVKQVGELLQKERISVEYLDERYTSDARMSDPDARSACEILETFLARQKQWEST